MLRDGQNEEKKKEKKEKINSWSSCYGLAGYEPD